MKRNSQPRIVVHGDYIDIHDNAFHGGTFNLTDTQKKSSEAPEAAAPEGLPDENATTDPVESLTPIFKGNEEWARQYLEALTGKTSVEITRITNQWVREGKIDARKKHKPLWEALKGGGLYDKGLSNWNSQID